jgi:D-3-phosphoglycerate dehydrogenase / 2-oxoglutarate reductase
MRVLITPVPFVRVDLLERAGMQCRTNPMGRRLTGRELIEMIPGTSILIASTEPITAEAMDASPELRLITRVGIGLDNVDLIAARKRNIAVSYTPNAPSPAVAELTIGLMIDLLRGISRADRLMHSRQWNRLLGRRLDGLTVGVIGVGRIGRRVIQILRSGFPSVTILANDLIPDHDFGQKWKVEWGDKDDLYSRSDIITIHVPLTRQTRNLIGEREIERMKPSSFVVNTSRGGIINESALAVALTSGRLQGAAIDVFEDEPYAGSLTSVENCILTCHMGSMSEDSRDAMELEAVEDVLRFARGEPLKQPVPDAEYENGST